ncbi:MAG TPA: TolC family outer membrane protein [Paraburkholderia sp.]|nr:TolC family outer membrane protein [Paraburkholderia sp.]
MASRSWSTCLALACFAYTCDGSATDLLTVVEQSIDHDADLAAARAGARAAQQAKPAARAALLPQLMGGWGRAYNSTSVQDMPRNTYWQNGWTVSLTQPVFDWSRWTAYRQADFVEARGAVEFAQAQQRLILQAVRTYFDVLAAQDELTRARDYTAALDSHLDQLRHRQASGEATVIDLREAEAAREQAQLQQQDAGNDLRLRQLTLEQMTGQPVSGLSRVADSARLPRLEPDDPQAWATQAEAHDYLVQLRQVDWRIAKLEIEKRRAERFPVVSLTASHTPAGAASGYASPTTTTTAMLSISIPIFTGGATQARVDESLALEEKAQGELLSSIRAAGATARESGTRLRAGIARIDALRRLVQTSGAALDATKLGYRVGSRESADVLRASEIYYTSRRDLIRARYEVLLALLQLKAAVAELDVDAVAQVNQLLEPAGPMTPADAVSRPKLLPSSVQ